VAALLAEGLDLAEVAGRLGHGISTARWHLKQIFDKTGARSQAALVALVRGFGDPPNSRSGLPRRT
jgi:DNA-binding CsgD family transcriptional regulator